MSKFTIAQLDPTRNHILIYQDTYVFGKGYLPSTKQKVAEKYYQIKFQK